MASRVTSAASSSSRQPFGAGGSLREHHVAHLRAAVVDVDRDVLVELQPELAQHRARLDDRARAVGEALVPGRRQAEHHPGIAGAERADDHVVLARACSRRPPDCRRRGDQARRWPTPSCEQPRLEGRIDPGAGDDLRPLQRADILLVLADPLVDGFGGEQPLLDQERLQRLGAQRHVGFLLRVVRHRQCPSRRTSSDRSPRSSLNSSGLQIAFPQIEGNRLAWLGGVAPQLAGVEADAVERLRLLAQPVRVRVGKDLRSMTDVG